MRRETFLEYLQLCLNDADRLDREQSEISHASAFRLWSCRSYYLLEGTLGENDPNVIEFANLLKSKMNCFNKGKEILCKVLKKAQ